MLFLALAGFSQVTISAGENSFSIGDNANYFKVFGADNFNPGASGANVVWDFSALTEDGSNNNFEYIDTTGLPHVETTVGTDVAEELNNQTNGYFYFDNNGGTQWNRTGFTANDGTIDLWINYDYAAGTKTSLQLYPDNFTYLTSHDIVPFGATGGWYMEGIGSDTAIIPEAAEYHFDCDAYGTLILPHKVYQNAMRVHITEEFQIQLLMGGTPAMTMSIDDDAYYWFVEGVRGPVMSYVVSNSAKETSYTLQWQKPYTALECDFIASDPATGVEMTSGNTDAIFEMLNLSYPLNVGSTFTWSFSPSTVEYVGGTNANSIHPQVKFTAPGTYSATLTINNSGFTPNSATTTKTDYITIEAAPQLVADFTADNTSLSVNGIANFTSDVSVSTGGGVEGTTTYQWAVSPGVSGTHWGFVNFTSNTDANPSIQFYQSGLYSIQLIVTNSTYSNSPVTVTKMNYINVGGVTAYTVTFTVTDGVNPISGATVSLSGNGNQTTDGSGQAVFNNVINGTYSYTVSATGFQGASGSVIVSGANTSQNVTLVPANYIVTFTVTDGTDPLQNAVITVDGEDPIVTNSTGNASISLGNGTYDFSVILTGYNEYSNSFTVNNSDLPVSIVMTLIISINENAENKLLVYPNPSNGLISVMTNEICNFAIYDIYGSKIENGNLNPNSVIDLTKYEKGIYFIKIEQNGKVEYQKIVLK